MSWTFFNSIGHKQRPRQAPTPSLCPHHAMTPGAALALAADCSKKLCLKKSCCGVLPALYIFAPRFCPPEPPIMSYKLIEDIIHRRAENDATIVFEELLPHGNSHRARSAQSFKTKKVRVRPHSYPATLGNVSFEITLQEKTALKIALCKYLDEHGEQPFPFIDKHRPTFVEFFRLKGMWEILNWTNDQLFDLCTEWPDAVALLMMDLREEIIKAIQKMHRTTTVAELEEKVLEEARKWDAARAAAI
jgi:hypothetical protein